MSIINVKGHKTISRIDNFKIGSLTYACCWGVKPNNTYWVLPVHSSPSLRVLICAKITPQSSGYLFGDEYFYITLNGLTIRWNNPNGIVTQTVTEGEHVIGFIDGKPALNGNLLSGTDVTRSTNDKPCWLGRIRPDSEGQLTNTYIRKVEVYGHSTNTTDVKQSWSYYATINGTKGHLVEKWSNTVLSIQAGGDAEPLTDAFPGYGISIEDLRQVVSTPHKDLVAIYTQDGGATTSTALEPEVAVATINNQEVRQEMAFRWMGRSLPEGYTLQSHPSYGTTQGIDGELIFGRKPTWNMWADNVNMGRYIGGSVSGSDIRQARIRFNPTMDKYGNRKPLSDGSYGFHLLDWDGYSPTRYHKPDLKVGALAGQAMPNITLNFVNGLCASLNKDFYQSDKANTSTTPRATPVLSYRRIAEVGGDIKFVLGNLVSWHEEIPYGDTSGNKIPIYGGYYGVRIGNSPDDTSNNLNGMMIMAGWDAEDVELNSNSSIEVRNKYRETGVSVEPSFFKLGTDQQNEIIALAEQNNNKITCYVDFGLLVTKKSNTNGFTNGLPNYSAMVSAHLITPQKNVEVELKKTGGYYVFADLPSNVSLVCDSQGDAAALPTHSVSNTPDVFVLPLIHNDVSNDYNPTFEATLILYKDGVQAGIISTKTSINKSQYQSLSDGYYDAWFGEGDHYAYKNGNIVSSSSVNNLINDGKVQFLVWTMSDILQFGNYTNFTEEVGGTRKFKSNISFKLENIKVTNSSSTDDDEFTFTVGSNEYTAVEGMTWETWIGSSYNTGIFYLDEQGYVMCNYNGEAMSVKSDASTWVESHHIIESRNYILD